MSEYSKSPFFTIKHTRINGDTIVDIYGNKQIIPQKGFYLINDEHKYCGEVVNKNLKFDGALGEVVGLGEVSFKYYYVNRKVDYFSVKNFEHVCAFIKTVKNGCV